MKLLRIMLGLAGSFASLGTTYAQVPCGYGITIVGVYHKTGGSDQSLSNGSSQTVSPSQYTITLTALTKQSYSPIQASFSPWIFGDGGAQGAYNTNNNTVGVVNLQQLYTGVSVSASATYTACNESASFSFRLYSSNSRLYAVPNPASTNVTIQLVSADDHPEPAPATPAYTAYLYNSQGTVVRTQQVSGQEPAAPLAVDDLPAGMYILRTSLTQEGPGQRIQVTH